MTKQEQEIKTIKERTITLKLSDADCEAITNKCGASGISVSELLEQFIGDLVDGTYSNGSDERDAANAWFERCWFGMFPAETLLSYLLTEYYEDPEEFIDLIDDITFCTNSLKEYEADPTDYDIKEIELTRIDLQDFNEQYQEIIQGFTKGHPNADIQEEINRIKEWVEKKANLLEGKERRNQ